MFRPTVCPLSGFCILSLMMATWLARNTQELNVCVKRFLYNLCSYWCNFYRKQESSVLHVACAVLYYATSLNVVSFHCFYLQTASVHATELCGFTPCHIEER